jgi:hypothetical protein
MNGILNTIKMTGKKGMKGSGGAREGSGRKKKEETVTTSFRINKAALMTCKKLYGRKLNAMVNEHIKALAGDQK